MDEIHDQLHELVQRRPERYRDELDRAMLQSLAGAEAPRESLVAALSFFAKKEPERKLARDE